MAKIIDFKTREILYNEGQCKSMFPWKNGKFSYNIDGSATNIYILARTYEQATIICGKLEMYFKDNGPWPIGR